MSADFWAGYISGAVGIIIGNPLDIIKVRLQAAVRLPGRGGHSPPLSPAPQPPQDPPRNHPGPSAGRGGRRTVAAATSALLTGTAAPVLGYGALNALLFVSYHRAEAAFNSALAVPAGQVNLWTTWLGGAVGGLATWLVSAPTELVKCRAQLATRGLTTSSFPSSPLISSLPPSPSLLRTPQPEVSSSSSWRVAQQVWRAEGLRGFYFGGGVTALRDSVGYGFYFWAYQLSSRYFATAGDGAGSSSTMAAGGTAGVGGGEKTGGSTLLSQEALKVLLCGGLAGIVTWASIFPLDVIKTRMQAQILQSPVSAPVSPIARERGPLLSSSGEERSTSSPSRTAAEKAGRRLGAMEIAREAYRQEGLAVFFRGLGVCSVRAFIVNAVQWAVYEWIMVQLGHPTSAAVGTT